MPMRALGDLVPALHGADAAVSAPPARRVAAVTVRGSDVALPALPAPLPRLPPAMATRLRVDLAPEGNAVATGEVIRERVGDEVVVVERPYRAPVRGVPASWRETIAEPVERLRRILETMADERIIVAWVQRWGAGVVNPPTEAQAPAKLELFVLALRDVPAIAFTTESVALAARRWKFWPTPSEALALCEEVVRPYRDMLRTLEGWLARPPEEDAAAWVPPDDRPRRTQPKTPEEIAAVQAIAATVMAEARAREAGRGVDTVRIGGAWTAARQGVLSIAERRAAEPGPDQARWRAQVDELRAERDRLLQQPMPGVALLRRGSGVTGAPMTPSGRSAQPAESKPFESVGPKADVGA